MSAKRKLKKRKRTVSKKKIELDIDQLEELLKRAEIGKLQESDIELIKAMVECIAI